MREFVHATFLFCAYAGLLGNISPAQSSSGQPDTIGGVVINSVTREPIERALVSSADNRFATLTNSEGRFEFTLEMAESGNEGSPNRPYMLIARKPGFLADPEQPGSVQNDATKGLTLRLIPQAVIAGMVTLPTSEAPDSVGLQIFRREVQDGRARWVAAGGVQSLSDGEFRIPGLQAGTYKLLTSELLDTDPLIVDPRVNPFDIDSRAPLFGYPPVYYQNAYDFSSATIIQLSAGQTQTLNLSLVKQPYYRVKIPVLAPGVDLSGFGLGVSVYTARKGPGFSLGYNPGRQIVEGMLPAGTYTVEVTGRGPKGVTMFGAQTIAIKGSAIGGPNIVMSPSSSIGVNVKEEFTADDHTGAMTFSINGRNSVVHGPRRYLNVTLEPVDDFGTGHPVSLRNPAGPADEALVLEGVEPGQYSVRVESSRGYATSIRSGNLDLLHQPLVVGVGGGASPIEITMRDDTAEISGKVEGIMPGGRGSGGSQQTGAHVLCIPLADSAGRFNDISVGQDGSFEAIGLAPGAYLLLAFEKVPSELEYRNPEAMQMYDSKGPVVRVVGGQKERVTLQLISGNSSTVEQ